MMRQSQMETFVETRFPVCFHADTQTGNPPSKGFPSLRVIFQTQKWKLTLFLRDSFQFPLGQSARDASVGASSGRFFLARNLRKVSGHLNLNQTYRAGSRMNSGQKTAVNLS